MVRHLDVYVCFRVIPKTPAPPKTPVIIACSTHALLCSCKVQLPQELRALGRGHRRG